MALIFHKEEWRSLASQGFSKYQVSSYGKVQNIQTCYTLTVEINTGYARVRVMHDNGKLYTKRVHTLVALEFLDNPANKPTVDHIDHDTFNNCLWNLRWATASEQNRNKRSYRIRGRPVNQYDIDGKFIARWERVDRAAKEGNISRKVIYKSLKNPGKVAGNHIWRYADEVDIDEEEEWRLCPFPEYELLHASSRGRIRRSNGKIVGQSKNHSGYMEVNVKLSINRKSTKVVRVHRLVAASFHGRNDSLEVDHLDRNKENNNPSNLEYVSRKENRKRAVQRGAVQETPVIQYDLQGKELARFRSINEAQRKTEIRHISDACSGYHKTAGNFIWKRENDTENIPSQEEIDDIASYLAKVGLNYKNKQPVVRIDQCNKIVACYSSMSEASIETGILIHRGLMKLGRNGKPKQDKDGFTWKYSSDLNLLR